jgi:hypothetical protein
MRFSKSVQRRRILLAVWLVTAGLWACSESDPADVEDGTVVGVWRTGSSGGVESTLEFRDDGIFRAIDAQFGTQRCLVSEGTWSQADNVLSIRHTLAEGMPSSEEEEVPYTLSGSTLVTQPGLADEEVWSRFGSMVTCADYGWPDFAMAADVDGVSMDFSQNPPTLSLEDAIRDGFLTVAGWSGAPGGETTACVTCQVLELEIFTELASPLVPGTYPMESFAAGGLTSRALLRVNYPSTDEHYRSDDGDPGTQPASGQVVLATVTAERIEGTFEFVAYDGRAMGPPYPLVTVTNGFFRLAFD